jgi:hypothetical protein
MPSRFQRHYTIEEARALLPQIRRWLARAQESLAAYQRAEKRIQQLGAPGDDLGGSTINNAIRHMADIQSVMAEFSSREIQVKDVDRGLLDFPAIIGGREVFLCWEQDEEDIEHWHELDAGFAGREPL